MLIDTHAHLYDTQFDSDFRQIVEDAKANDVSRIVLPNIDSSTIEKNLKLENDDPEVFTSLMGLHPGSVQSNYRKELDRIEQTLKSRSFKGIGEIGLDFYWDKTFIKEQEEVFRTQVDWAIELNIPIVIHSRDSIDKILSILYEKQYKGKVRGIFHCFTGTEKQANQIMDLGMLMGIGGIVTFKNSGLAETLENVPLDALVLETDAPYLAPVPHRGKRNESGYLKLIAKKLSNIYKEDYKFIGEKTTLNATKVFDL